MKKLNKKYIIQIRAILAKQQIDEEGKEDIVYNATDGRTTHISHMNTVEAIALIKQLNGKNDNYQHTGKKNQMRRKIIALCHEMGWQDDEGKIDMNRVNAFCEKRGHGKKPLNDYTTRELPALISQFESMHKTYTSNS